MCWLGSGDDASKDYKVIVMINVMRTVDDGWHQLPGAPGCHSKFPYFFIVSLTNIIKVMITVNDG